MIRITIALIKIDVDIDREMSRRDGDPRHRDNRLFGMQSRALRHAMYHVEAITRMNEITRRFTWPSRDRFYYSKNYYECRVQEIKMIDMSLRSQECSIEKQYLHALYRKIIFVL